MMNPLPVFISIPHGGTQIPRELQDRVCLSPKDLFDDSDAYTPEIYHLGDAVAGVMCADIARACIDLNRAPDDVPPHNPDGVVKSQTCYGKQIYQSGLEPGAALTEMLLKTYYAPYHRHIQHILRKKRAAIDVALDCHSMAAEGPEISPDKGRRRPLVCLGNAHGQSCSHVMINTMALCFRQAFSLQEYDVSINRPFAGGYITRTYGGHPLPWIQVELNRSLYFRPPFFDRNTRSINKGRLLELRGMFEDALCLFFKNRLIA
jgi:formiminoglutamase